MAEMKPPSSHRSSKWRGRFFFSVALVYAAKMWSTPNWKRSLDVVNFLILTKAAHCSSGFTPLQKKIKCEDPLYVLEDPRIFLHKNKNWIHQQTTHKWWFGRSISFQLRGFACNCGGQRRPRIEPSSWNFFNLGIVAENYLVYLWVEPPFPTPKKWAAMKILGWDFLSLCFCKNSGGDEHMLGRVWSPRYSLKISWLIQRSLPIFSLARKSSWCIISLTKSSALQFWIHCLELVTWNIKSSEKDNLDTKSTLSSKCSTPN